MTSSTGNGSTEAKAGWFPRFPHFYDPPPPEFKVLVPGARETVHVFGHFPVERMKVEFVVDSGMSHECLLYNLYALSAFGSVRGEQVTTMWKTKSGHHDYIYHVPEDTARVTPDTANALMNRKHTLWGTFNVFLGFLLKHAAHNTALGIAVADLCDKIEVPRNNLLFTEEKRPILPPLKRGKSDVTHPIEGRYVKFDMYAYYRRADSEVFSSDACFMDEEIIEAEKRFGTSRVYLGSALSVKNTCKAFRRAEKAGGDNIAAAAIASLAATTTAEPPLPDLNLDLGLTRALLVVAPVLERRIIETYAERDVGRAVALIYAVYHLKATSATEIARADFTQARAFIDERLNHTPLIDMRNISQMDAAAAVDIDSDEQKEEDVEIVPQSAAKRRRRRSARAEPTGSSR